MKTSLLKMAGPANYARIFNQDALRLGFSSSGEIDRFVFNTYKETIKNIPPADYPRGVVFVLEPASVDGEIGAPSELKPLLKQIISSTTSTVYSLCIDLNEGLKTFYFPKAEDKQMRVSNAWPQRFAQLISKESGKCVVWLAGIIVHVYINGNLYLDTSDVREGLPSGLPEGFQRLSWGHGDICFHFADSDLNDRGPTGIWYLHDIRLLRPKPELIISRRFGKFLRYCLAGYFQHYQEAHVENEGRADISLHMVDDRTMIIEVKWIGQSLVGTHVNKKEEVIKRAVKNNTGGWLTKFDDNNTITSGVRQLVQYYSSSKYQEAYLTVFDCSPSARRSNSCCVEVPAAAFSGFSADKFRILRACVDPRSASRRARS